MAVLRGSCGEAIGFLHYLRLIIWRGKFYADFLFLLSKVCQDPVDDVLVLNACDDPERTTAASAHFNVHIEHALEPLGPGHCDVSFRGVHAAVVWRQFHPNVWFC